ncbi:MAG: hypothetical protein GEU98_27615 [Pseudonocardiaceae bacterium]|nr:hypothetical protein [Pseudonocardiaceae bacterium]
MAPQDSGSHSAGPYGTSSYAGDSADATAAGLPFGLGNNPALSNAFQGMYASNQAENLSEDVVMGEDRVIADPPNWEGMSSEQLYLGATQQNDPGSADRLGHTWNEQGNALANAANELHSAIAELGSAWTGDAAAAAQGSLAGLAASSGRAGQAAQMMGNRLAQQSVAAANVKGLPQPKNFDAGQSMAAMIGGGPAALAMDMKAQKDAADSVKAEQVKYLTAYTQSMSDVDSSTPTFDPDAYRGRSSADDGRGGGAVLSTPDGGTGYGAGPASGAGAFTGEYGANGEEQIAGMPMSGPGAGTNTAGYTGGPVGGAAAPAAASAPAPQPSGGLGSAGFGGAFGGFGAMSGGARTGSSNQRGNSTSSARSASIPGGQGTGGPASGPSTGAQTGATGGYPGGVAPTAGMGGDANRGGSGRPGAAGAPMAGGARGQGQEDEDYERASYLIEPDPEDAFGADSSAAPPVIGE